jgi:hypothetical protein
MNKSANSQRTHKECTNKHSKIFSNQICVSNRPISITRVANKEPELATRPQRVFWVENYFTQKRVPYELMQSKETHFYILLWWILKETEVTWTFIFNNS